MAKEILQWSHMSEDIMQYNVQQMFDKAMYSQSNIRGVCWYRMFEYLKNKRYDLTCYLKPKN